MEERNIQSLSNNDLLAAINRRFDEQDRRFDEVDVSKNGLLEAINRRFDAIDDKFGGIEGRFGVFEGRFDGLEGRFDKLENRFDGLEGRFDGFEVRFDGLEGHLSATDERLEAFIEYSEGRFDSMGRDLGAIRATMVTKDYLDTRLFRIAGEFGTHLRKEDEKVNALAGLLAEKSLIDKRESSSIVAMGPYKNS